MSTKVNIFKKFTNHPAVRCLILIIFAVITIISLVSYNPSDPSFNLVTNFYPNNFIGYFGSYISDMLYQILGITAFIIPLCLIFWAHLIHKEEKIKWLLPRLIAMCISITAASIVLNVFPAPTLPSRAGGTLGIILWKYLSSYGTTVIIVAGISSMLFLAFAVGIKMQTYCAITFVTLNLIKKLIIKKLKILVKLLEIIRNNNLFTKKIPAILIKNTLEPEFKTEQNLITNKSIKPKKTTDSTHKTPIQNSENIIPPLDLLDSVHENKIKMSSKAELDKGTIDLLSVLEDFGIKGKIIDVKQGPVVTLYEFEPAAGTKSSRVIGLSDDIARSLSALSTRIAIIPGRNVLGIELPNKSRAFFRLKELIETEEFQNHTISLPLILGKDLSGKPLVADLAKMPHLLVAGTTGSGKSVAINAMIMSLLYRYTPDECRMVMIDPKMLELSAYDDIPHLMTPVVTEPGKAVVALKWAVKEMENRYRLMSNLGVRSIANYNTKIMEAINDKKTLERKIQTGFDPETGKPIYESVPIEMKKMPFIVVIVDEMADLMLVAGKDIEGSIQRLAQMARAAGIHLIMATQRPSVDVITGVIKANFPSRISFKVTSKIDSRTILGEQGAEQLLGMGDMLYMGNSARILRVHGPFVDDKEVERVTDFLRTTGYPEYISAVTESLENEIDANESLNDSENDEIYKQAVNIVKNERKASISYIQRSLRIGYNRAATIVELMEKNGIVSSPNHSGKREVLLPEN
jgi:S-DNA-T family DNA segregation ATPase FtsK/SpoIIIE